MKMLIIEGVSFAEICTKFNASPEAAAIADVFEYGFTLDVPGKIIFTLFYK